MKEVAVLLLLALTLSACGNTSTPVQTAVGGNWQAQLSGGEGQESGFSFITNFTVSGTGGGLTFSTFQFLTAGQCFPIDGESPTGTVALTVNQTTFAVTGPFNFTVTSGGNTLTLTGTLTGTENGVNGTIFSGGTVTGTWTLTGTCAAGSSVTGNFIMTQGSTSATSAQNQSLR